MVLKRERTWVDRRFLNWGYRAGVDEGIEEVVEGQAQLDALVWLGEGPNIEFKVELPLRQAGNEAMNFLRTVVAFANGQGGTILFGVTDDGDVLGLPRTEAESRARDRITDLVRATVTPVPSYALELYDVEGQLARVVLGLRIRARAGAALWSQTRQPHLLCAPRRYDLSGFITRGPLSGPLPASDPTRGYLSLGT